MNTPKIIIAVLIASVVLNAKLINAQEHKGHGHENAE
jgi:hypothetical protein